METNLQNQNQPKLASPTEGHLRLGMALIQSGQIEPHQLNDALSLAKETGEPLGQVLVNKGFITEAQLFKALALQKDAELWNLSEDPPTQEALQLVPAVTCARYRVVPIAIYESTLVLGMNDTDDFEAIDHVTRITGLHIKPVLVRDSEMREYLQSLNESNDAVASLVTQALDLVQDHHELYDHEASISENDTAPVVGLVNQVIADAIAAGASDVHLEPRCDRVEVRFRLDGLLHEMRQIPVRLLRTMVARLKIMSELDITESRRPQDGRFTAKLGTRSVDVRVSVLPNHYGPRVVLRLLDGSVASRALTSLGFSADNLKRYSDLMLKPYGMILVTGPTGSGKTTTLYATINNLRNPTTNIMTCEDPIEYDLDGINQSQVNDKIGLTFAAQLRAILRQDPDVVLIGEVRDKDACETAMRASMTGHLVLSTLHSNDALSALPRLYDIGAEPYLLSTSLTGVTAQRLARKLCSECKRQDKPSLDEVMLFDGFTLGNTPDFVYRPMGCEKCHGIGYKGRIGIHEVVPVVPDLAREIAAKVSVTQLAEVSMSHGFQPMQFDGLMKAAEGVTSVTEIARILTFEHYGTISRLAA